MNHKYSNMQIVRILHRYFNKNPEIRFIQGLWNLGIIDYEDRKKFIIKDRHYEESDKTLKGMEQFPKSSKLDLIHREMKYRINNFRIVEIKEQKNKIKTPRKQERLLTFFFNIVGFFADHVVLEDEDKDEKK